MNLAQKIAYLIDAYRRCRLHDNDGWAREWAHNHALRQLESRLPSGSGLDAGTKIDLDASTSKKLVLTTSFHHMEHGSYDGWTEHTVTVQPTFIDDLEIRVSGRNRNGVKDHIADVFRDVLSQTLCERRDCLTPADTYCPEHANS